MAIASLNVNNLLLHIDEIGTLVKDLGILFWLLARLNLMVPLMVLSYVLMAIPLRDAIVIVMVVALHYILKIRLLRNALSV